MSTQHGHAGDVPVTLGQDSSFRSLSVAPSLGNDPAVQSVYDAAGGDEGLLRLAEAWHARVMADEVVSHAFSHGFHRQHSERLAAYWAEALGGPRTYSERYGDETAVVRIHSGNGPHEEMDRRAIACFDQALTDVGLTQEPLRADAARLLRLGHHHNHVRATTTPPDDVPEGLGIPRWSWDGLQALTRPRAAQRGTPSPQ